MFSVLFNIWTDNTDHWSNIFSTSSIYLKKLSEGFMNVTLGYATLEKARDNVRVMLNAHDSTSFPMGENYAYLDMLPQQLFSQDVCAIGQRKCLLCNYIKPGTSGTMYCSMSIPSYRQ